MLRVAGERSTWRVPEMVVPFVVYCLVIAGGLVFYIVVGLTER